MRGAHSRARALRFLRGALPRKQPRDARPFHELGLPAQGRRRARPLRRRHEGARAHRRLRGARTRKHPNSRRHRHQHGRDNGRALQRGLHPRRDARAARKGRPHGDNVGPRRNGGRQGSLQQSARSERRALLRSRSTATTRRRDGAPRSTRKTSTPFSAS